MVTVGNDELLVVHLRDELANDGGVADSPDAMENVVLVSDFAIGGTVVVEEELIDGAGGVRVEHEDLAEMGAGGFEEIEAIALGLAQGLLVAIDDLVRVFMELSNGDEAATLFNDGGSGNGEALRISEDAGLLLLNQDAFFAPGLQIRCGARVDTFTPLGVKEFRQAENDADEIVGAPLVVCLLHGGRDFVVRLSGDVLKPDFCGVVMPCSKWIDAGHGQELLRSKKNDECKGACEWGCAANAGTKVIVTQRFLIGMKCHQRWHSREDGGSC